jgi:uncharacterized sulfatase
VSTSPGGLELSSTPDSTDGSQGKASSMDWIRTADEKNQSDTNVADRALAFLESHRNEPFFLAAGFLRPHLPFVAPGKFYDLYPLDRIPLPDNPPGDLNDMPAAHKGVRPYLWEHMKTQGRGALTEKEIREARRGYYASTSFMDEQVGRVLSGLEKLGLAENTIIVFWGDHGWSLGEHTHWQKMSLTEEVARVPLIVAAPGKRGNGQKSRALVEFLDIYPTLSGLCGLQAPPELEGTSMAPLLDQPQEAFKQAAFTQIAFEKIRGLSVRTEHFRYNTWRGLGDGEELYDHQTDPGEFTNLAGKPQWTGELERHRALAREYGLERAFGPA